MSSFLSHLFLPLILVWRARQKKILDKGAGRKGGLIAVEGTEVDVQGWLSKGFAEARIEGTIRATWLKRTVIS